MPSRPTAACPLVDTHRRPELSLSARSASNATRRRPVAFMAAFDEVVLLAVKTNWESPVSPADRNKSSKTRPHMVYRFSYNLKSTRPVIRARSRRV
eukprot:677858-Hanusia_phi.AAC.4